MLAYVTRRQGEWGRSESYFTKPSGLTRATFGCLLTRRSSYSILRRFPEALRKFDQVLNIIPDDVDTLSYKAAILQAEGDLPRAARYSRRCVRLPTTTVPWRHKFTRRSWSVALHKSSLGLRKY